MSIDLVTYANKTVTPMNDAIIYENAIDQNGIFYGVSVSVSGNDVTVGGGYGIICGREFVIQSETISVTLAPSSTLLGRLYVRLDLADADSPIQLLTAQGATLPSLQQDSNVNYVNGAWEMELATFDVGVSQLDNCVATYETITGSKNTIPSGVADYITEQGTSGIWTYRKWNSGLMECFGTYTANIAITTSSAGYGGYRSGQLNIPTLPVTYTNAPTITATTNSDGGAWVNNVAPTTTGGTFYLSCGSSSATISRSIGFYVIGI